MPAAIVEAMGLVLAMFPSAPAASAAVAEVAGALDRSSACRVCRIGAEGAPFGVRVAWPCSRGRPESSPAADGNPAARIGDGACMETVRHGKAER